MTTAARHMTLRELQRRVRQSLEESFALPVWVVAEIAELKVNYSGHCYIELVEKGGANGVPTAQARAVIWRSNFGRIAAEFEGTTGQRLAAGIQILAHVLVTYHEIYGFSLQIIDIDPSFTLGDMERQRQQTIAQLHADGVWEMNRELPAPVAPQRVAVVSSAQAAGYRDFCKQIGESHYRFTLTLFDAFMQGADAETSIIGALCRVAERAGEFDVVAVIRGGGSAADLNCFNAYGLSSHIAQFPLPVLTGIGHDKDTSVADMVAFRALKTPTAVAEWLVGEMAAVEGALQSAALRLRDMTRKMTFAQHTHLQQIAAELKQISMQQLLRYRIGTEQLTAQLRDAATALNARHRMRLSAAEEIVAAHSPERLMRLGFATLHGHGRAITSACDVAAGDTIEITLKDGKIDATVKTKTIWQKRQ